MKRYFSEMVDMYPQESFHFILAREHVKKLKSQLETAMDEYNTYQHALFSHNSREPLKPTDQIPSVIPSKVSSPAKE